MADLNGSASLDTRGLLCPVPIIKLAERMRAEPPGATVRILSDDPGIAVDLPAWCEGHGHALLSLEEDAEGCYEGEVRKAGPSG